MKIAVDARELEGEPTGVGRVLEGLLGAWPPGDRLRLVSREPIRTIGLQEGWDTDVHPGTSRLPGSLWEQLSLPGRVRRFRADFLLSPAYGMPLAAPCPVAVGMHDCAFAALPGTFGTRERLRRSWNARIAGRRAAFLFMGSSFAAAEAHRHLGVDEARVEVLPYGVDSRFRPAADGEIRRVRERYDLPSRPLLFVGAHLTRRGMPGLIERLGERAAAHTGVELCRLGSGPATDHGPASRWLGYVDDNDLPALYSAAELVLYPSRYEGFGLPVLEALACGTPVLTSRTSSLEELFDGRATLLPADDLDAWVSAVLERIESPAAGPESTGASEWARGRDWKDAAERLRQRLDRETR